MMARKPQTRRLDNVRIGPITIITLIAVICMAVLGVLAASTANATMTISERQAQATDNMYRNERAAQEFVAGVDEHLAPLRGAGAGVAVASQAVKVALDDICVSAREAAEGAVDVVANVDGAVVTAEFTCADSRKLLVELSLGDDASYRIEKWKMISVQGDAGEVGHLWTGE